MTPLLVALSDETVPDAGTLGTRSLLILALLGGATALWWLVHRRDGRFRAVDRGTTRRGVHVSAADLGRPLGRERTFVQFSSAGCSSCPQVRRVLRELVATEPLVEHVEVMVEDHVLLVERLGVRRTPTVLLLGPDGEVLARESGPVRPDQAREALATSGVGTPAPASDQ